MTPIRELIEVLSRCEPDGEAWVNGAPVTGVVPADEGHTAYLLTGRLTEDQKRARFDPV